MFKLKKVTVHKYKSYTNTQSISIEDNITTLVGKNESGKTAFLEAIAKFNYFTNDDAFKFNAVHDYPRSELKKYQRSDETDTAITCVFQIDKATLSAIEQDLGPGVLSSDTFTVSTNYENGRTWTYLHSKEDVYLKNLQASFEVSPDTSKELKTITNINKLTALEGHTENSEVIELINHIKTEVHPNSFKWSEHRLDAYISKTHLQPNLPRFWYFDEYYELPSRISISSIAENKTSESLSRHQLETAKALFELAVIDINQLSNSSNFESFIAELEATSNEITDKIFEYWSTNSNLSIEFKIDTIPRDYNRDPEKVLDIRVKNNRHRISLPLKNRSKGFNWFFSFIVWFSKIQDDKDKNFILLLDEPGLNLHASAQADLMRFIKDLSKEYQVIYSTHSPFMIESSALNQVRTVYDSDNGTVISDAIQEKDPDTLFPLQAALGYDIAQNLFVSKNNLLVEGPSDLNYLTYMSNLLESNGRTGLKHDITIVPVGGLDKVVSFISLLRGSKLKIACLLDTFNSTSSSQRLETLIQSKIIKDKQVRFFDEFTDSEKPKADIEDLFDTDEYLKLFGLSFPEHLHLSTKDLDKSKPTILLQIKAYMSGKNFNHYKPSHALLSSGMNINDFSSKTLDRFEKMFNELNKLF